LALLDARRLTREVAEVVQLRATDAAATSNDDLGEHRAVDREDALDTDAVRDLADGERFADARATTRNAHAFERLNALLFAFLHAHVDAKGVAGTESRDVTEPLFLGFDESMHMTLCAANALRV